MYHPILRPTRALGFSSILAACLGVSCSGDSAGSEPAGESDSDNGGRPGTGGEAGDEGSSDSADAGEADNGAVPDEGSDATASPDAPAPPDGSFEDQACLTVEATANPAVQPADIIFVIDTSGSMDNEAAAIEANMNRFVEFVTAEDSLDLRVVMVANDPGVRRGFETLLGICIPPPLGGAPDNCRADTVLDDGPDSDSDRYLHVREIVFSREPLAKFIEHYGKFSWFLRPGVPTHIVVISDDESFLGGDSFMRQVEGLTPGFPQGYRLHAIVSERTGSGFICDEDESECACRGAEAAGDGFIAVQEATGGVFQSICTNDWSGVFSTIADAVREDSVIPCEYGIPDPGEFEEIFYDRVEVRFRRGASESIVPVVFSEAQCDPVAGGWYYDNPASPTVVRLCPASCGQTEGDLVVAFECVKA